jgi:hypothetical protein
MRILRLTAVAVAATATILVDPRAALAFQLPGLSLSPGSGPSTTRITASYSFLPQQQDQEQQGGANCKKETVTFSWDGQLHQRVNASSAHGQGQGQGFCVAELTFPPPRGLDAPGTHFIQAVNGRASDTKPFTITGTAAPAPAPPTQGASPTGPDSSPATSPRTSSQSANRSSAHPSTSASTSAEPLPSEDPSSAAAPAVVGGAMKPPSGGSIATIIAIIVGAMTIAGAGLLFAMVIRRRPDADEVSGDAATAEA